METNAPTVRHVLGKLSKSQLKKVKSYSESNKFSQSWYWHGPEGDKGMDYKSLKIEELGEAARACALAVAFDVNSSTRPGNFWGAKVDENLMSAMEHLSEASGGDVGTVNYILELSKLSHDELVSIIDDSLNDTSNLDAHTLPDFVHREHLQQVFLDRSAPDIKHMSQAPTVRKILSAFSKKQLGKLLKYSIGESFHHGWYWFGPEGNVGVVSNEERFVKEGCGDPIAVAFELTPSRDATSWRGCRLDKNFMEALEFWAKHAGEESGMEEYVVELNSLSSEELDRMIRGAAAEALIE